jgi:L-ascorbate metabolism protein UlaG (beta-lactamase superfamily)
MNNIIVLVCFAFLGPISASAAPLETSFIYQGQSTGMPTLKAVQVQNSQEIRLQISAPTNQVCRLEISSDLTAWRRSVTWLPTKSSLINYTDSAAPFVDRRFYRLQSATETNVALGDHLLTSEGEVVFRQVSFGTLLFAWEGKHIYIDPSTINLVPPNANLRGFPKADLILITHDHVDHLDPGGFRCVLKSNSVIISSLGAYNGYYCAQVGYPNILQSLVGITILTNGIRTNVLGIGIQALPAYQLSSVNEHPRTAGYNGYVLTLGGKQLYISGDTGVVPEMLALTDIEIAFISVAAPLTMSASEAVGAVCQFKPRIVYPFHSNQIPVLNPVLYDPVNPRRVLSPGVPIWALVEIAGNFMWAIKSVGQLS